MDVPAKLRGRNAIPASELRQANEAAARLSMVDRSDPTLMLSQERDLEFGRLFLNAIRRRQRRLAK
jgi:hypothetical protein